jgi:hypothetical protein
MMMVMSIRNRSGIDISVSSPGFIVAPHLIGVTRRILDRREPVLWRAEID